MVIYRFDSAKTYCLIESRTTACEGVKIEPVRHEDRTGLRITFRREPGGSEEATLAIALPLRSIGGAHGPFVLDAHGDATDLRFRLHGLDAENREVAYMLSRSDTDDTHSADMSHPEGDDATPAALPLQLHQLSITITARAVTADVTLFALHAAGDLHLVPSGLA